MICSKITEDLKLVSNTDDGLTKVRDCYSLTPVLEEATVKNQLWDSRIWTRHRLPRRQGTIQKFWERRAQILVQIAT